MRNPIDAIVAFFDPRAGYRRHVERRVLQRAYEAAAPGDGWRPRRGGASANADHRADATTLRNKARSLRQNVGYVTAGMNARSQYGVGTGVTSEFNNVRMNEVWVKWVKQCDVLEAGGWGALQKRAWDTMDTDGEVLVRLRPRYASDGLAVPLQLQLLEVDWLDTSRSENPNNGNAIINGIEYDQLGRKVSYWLFDTHPGDVGVLKRTLRNQSKAVPAREIIHLYVAERPEQDRGITRLASVINRTRDFSVYEDAERARKNLETMLAVVASGDTGDMAQDDSPIVGGNVSSTDLGTLKSGGITQLPSGLNISTVQPNPMPGYAETAKLELHLIAAGGGFTYEQATGDMRESNFTQGRMRMTHFRREIEQVQWLTFIPVLLERVTAAFVAYGALANLWPDDDKWSVEHTCPKWDYIQPEQEVNADIKEIGAGLATISGKLRGRGEDPKKIFAQWKKDMDQLKSDGTWEFMLFLMKGNLPTPGAEPDSNSTEPKP